MDTRLMDTRPAFGFKELFNHLVGDIAKAIAQRGGESKQQQITRSEAAIHMIMGFLPRDVVEAILAGHCVMFHELMVDTTRHTLLGEVEATRRATRSGIVAMDRAFANNLTRLEQYRLRPSDGRRDAPEAAPVDAQPETVAPTSDPVVETRPAVVATRDLPTARPDHRDDATTEATLYFSPSVEAIAACEANPEAMAALQAGDAERFAHAMGIDAPSGEFLAAAANSGSLFNRHASETRVAGAAPAEPKA